MWNMTRGRWSCAVLLFGSVLAGGCDQKKAPAPEAVPSVSAPAVESAKPAELAPVGKALEDWSLADLKSALSAGGFALGTSQDGAGDDGAGVTNRQLRVVAKRDGKYLEVQVVHFQGADDAAVKKAIESSRGLHAEAVTHQEGNSIAYFESKDTDLAKKAATALLGKAP